MAFYPYAAFNLPDPVSSAVSPFADAMRNIVNYRLTQQADEEQYQRLMDERDRLEKIRIEGVDLAAQHRLEDREDREALRDEGRAFQLMSELPPGRITEEQYNIISPHSKRAFLQEERSMIPGAEITPTYWLGQTAAQVQQDIENEAQRQNRLAEVGLRMEGLAIDKDRLKATQANTAATRDLEAQNRQYNRATRELGRVDTSYNFAMDGITPYVNNMLRAQVTLAANPPVVGADGNELESAERKNAIDSEVLARGNRDRGIDAGIKLLEQHLQSQYPEVVNLARTRIENLRNMKAGSTANRVDLGETTTNQIAPRQMESFLNSIDDLSRSAQIAEIRREIMRRDPEGQYRALIPR